MFCNKCGTQNPDTSFYCSKCGEKLNISPEAQMPVQGPKKRKAGLLIGLISGGLAVIAGAVVLILIFSGAARTVTGDWYSKEYGEMFTLRADGTVLLTTSYGQASGSYKYDAGSGKGVISIGGKDIEFTAGNGEIVLLGEGGATAAFDRVEDAAEVAGMFPAPSSEFTPPPVVTEPPAVATPSAPVSSPEITPTITEYSPTPTLLSAPTSTPIVLPPPATPPPTPMPTPWIFIPIIIPDNSDVEGSWSDGSFFHPTIITFNADNTYYYSVWPVDPETGTYYYDPSTLTGTLTPTSGDSRSFHLSADKLLLEFDGGGTFGRYTPTPWS